MRPAASFACITLIFCSACIYEDECVGGARREGGRCTLVTDAGTDAHVDAGLDAAPTDTGTPGLDAGVDGSVDAGGGDSGPCDGGLSWCGDACVDTTVSRQHCGGCDSPCSWQCVDGSCDEVEQIAVGAVHACVRLASGRVQCWGDNRAGQLGDGTTTDRPRVGDVPGLDDATQLVSSAGHTCALTESRGVRCWGLNDVGQIGTTSGFETEPIEISGVESAADVYVGHSLSCVALGIELQCWGENMSGQLGDGTNDDSLSPVTVVDIDGVEEAAPGGEFACARLVDNSIHCWGDGGEGELGIGTMVNHNRPQQIPSFTAIELDTSDEHACARKTDGSVWCWGDNREGQITGMRGDPADYITTPTQLEGIDDAIGIATGDQHVCVLHSGGTVSCRGYNASGQLGDGSTVARTGSVTVSGLDDAVEIDGGHGDFTCARRETGDLVCWGANFSGMIGDGTSGAGVVRPEATPVLPPE